jgi:hypothetical protein
VATDATRRGVLAATALALPALVTGCKGFAVLGAPPRPAPEVAVTRAAIESEIALITRYQAALARRPGLRPLLRPILAQHVAHRARLRSRLIVPPGSPPLPSPRDRTPAPAPGTAVAQLADAEDAAATALLAHLSAVSPSLAQLLASIAASEATHAAALRAGPSGQATATGRSRGGTG